MKNKDTGEFELVVGDKQLLSGFFIGVVLLAVVFALGYVLGRSSPKSAGVAPETAAAASSSAPETRPPAASLAAPPSPEPVATTPVPQTADTARPVEPPPQPITVPARESIKAAAPPVAAPLANPANTTYWQVTAASRNSADAVFLTLKDKGFAVSTRPGPNNLTLVWVGPYTDKDSLTRAKKQLEDAGFNPISKHP